MSSTANKLVESSKLSSMEEIKNLVKAATPIIQVVASDEIDFITKLGEMCGTTASEGNKLRRQLFLWSAWRGIIQYQSENTLIDCKRATDPWENSWQPSRALELIANYKVKDEDSGGAIFVMQDMHTILAQPIPRQLKDMFLGLSKQHKTIIIVGNQLAHGQGGVKSGIEPSLEKQIAIVHHDLPTRKSIEVWLRDQFSQIKETPKAAQFKKVEYSDDEYFQISRALQGLTHVEVSNAVSVALAADKVLLPERLINEKKQIILRSDTLEYIDSKQTLDDLGGMDNLKQYFLDNANAFSEEAESFGVEPVRGVVLVGVPGSGKSACAKALGNTWKVPTVRLDIGKVMTGLVGGSEEKMRAVIQQAEAIAPCVLWVDEVEKALSGTKSSNFSDGGTLARVFGTLLTKMQEGLEGVVVIATANDITMLPPEFIRRFSEVFFVTLPTETEREEIWRIHLAKKKRDPKKFDLKKLVKESDKFTGAEIEKVVKAAINRCYNDEKREVKTDDLITALQSTKPISTVMKDEIKKTMDWAVNRARFASSFAEKEYAPGNQSVTTKGGKKMKLSDLEDDLKLKKDEDKEKPKATGVLANITED